MNVLVRLRQFATSARAFGVDLFNCPLKSTDLMTIPDESVNVSVENNTINQPVHVSATQSVDGSICGEPVNEAALLDQLELKRKKEREYKQRYRERKRRAKEEAKARQVVLNFQGKRETSNAEQLNEFILAIGQNVATTLCTIMGDDEFVQFTEMYKGQSRLDLIMAMIETLNSQCQK